jgi:hypothetical protein
MTELSNDKDTFMKNNQTTKWIVDITLAVIFLLEFFLDLTGLGTHQWIGLAAGGLAAYHLFTHWSWVKRVSIRFFQKTSMRARWYYLIDAAILAGCGVIGVTGLAISTWLNMALNSYQAWTNVHIQASILTLVLTGIKVGLHWRWVTTIARRIFSRPTRPVPLNSSLLRPAQVTLPVQSGNQINRRDFLKMMAIVGVASVFALRSAASGLSDANTSTASELSDVNTSTASVEAAGSDDTNIQDTDNLQTDSRSSSESSASSQACMIQCNRGCSYPGHCRRYQDTNGNNRCDLSECI